MSHAATKLLQQIARSDDAGLIRASLVKRAAEPACGAIEIDIDDGIRLDQPHGGNQIGALNEARFFMLRADS
jgi:hypothetical protein